MGGSVSTGGGAGDTGGVSAGGTGGSVAGTAGGGAAGTGGGSSAVWQCPAGVTGTPMLSGTPARVTSVPPPDDFNMNNGNFGNVEGPVWIDDALYVSEMSYKSYTETDGEIKMSRVLKVTADGQASIFIADSGSNGLAVDSAGDIVAGVHKDGSITRFPLPSGAAVPIVSTFMNARFNSPNDLAIRSDGTIYFSDPNFQAPNNKPQAQTRVYRVPPGGQAEPIPNGTTPDMFGNPNGVTLSLAEDFLYVAASTGRRYPVMADGSLGAGADFSATNGGDGMAVDCAGNLYVAKANQAAVSVYTADGTSIGTITVNDVQSVTNVAFGGADHQTLYITGLGNNKGLFKLSMNLPGRQY
jgi:gluconolactonase